MRNYENDFTALSLFPCGGLMDIGMDRAGLRIAGAVDWDAWALAAHQLHLPGVPVLERDLVKTPAAEVLKDLGVERCDVLVSTPPCQCWTMANGKSGTEHDERRFCLPVVATYSAVLKPRVVLLENVLGSALGRLTTAETGYTQGEYQDLKAALESVRRERGKA